jgi:asparagine synthase (glutamine-hydrolysing)
MSTLSGLLSFDHKPLDLTTLETVAQRSRQHDYNQPSKVCFESVGLIYQSFDSSPTMESELQPHLSDTGTTLMWDGRLDNRKELLAAIGDCANDNKSDVEVLHALYDKNGPNCLAEIIGDWAMCVWSAREQKILLACDFSGLRRIYYCKLPHCVIWCTDLEALVSGSGRIFELNDDYVAEYLQGIPGPSLTPYLEIHAVPPGHLVEIREREISIRRYWSWNTEKPIVYKSDGEYEDHCRLLLRQSVKRRLQSRFPVSAELSGGVDSSSIVCLAHDILNSEGAGTPSLHTLSYYHDEEPSCDERPYFSVIEQAVGRVGTHINSARYDTLTLDLGRFVPLPIYPQGAIDAERDLGAFMRQHSAHTLLSGIGGDEFLGGVPTGIPELADLVREAAMDKYWASLGRWSTSSRVSRWHLLRESVAAAMTSTVCDSPIFAGSVPSVMSSQFEHYARSRPHIGSAWSHRMRPSQRAFIEVWLGLSRQLVHTQAPMFGCYERAYPYLDRDVLSFLFNVPRAQIIRAGQRRSLMRRTLASLVPHEILWRRNKATAIRRNMRIYASLSAEIANCIRESLLVRAGYVDYGKFLAALDGACNGVVEHSFPVMRVIALDTWLKAASQYVNTNIGNVGGRVSLLRGRGRPTNDAYGIPL